MDLIWQPRSQPPLAIECKWSARDVDPANLLVFARAYPQAQLMVVTTDARPAFHREHAGVRIESVTLDRLIERVSPS